MPSPLHEQLPAGIGVDESRDGVIRARMAPLTPERLDDVLELEQAAFRHAWTSRKRFGEYIDGRRAFALFSGDALAGYLLVAFRDDALRLDKMAVSPLHRRRGLGRFTLRWVERHAAELGLRAVFLRVRESNREAISLYESEGFAVVARKEGYYRHTDHEAALEMRKAVSGA
ncbi:MAG TPA: GNAT family N-acetyltransferase [Longimicrobiaceae bacterium]|jgi:ribosomal-protein-alanine N-acetyltransferase